MSHIQNRQQGREVADASLPGGSVHFQCAVPNDSVLLLEQRCVAGLNSELTVHIHKMEIERMLEIVVEKALDIC